MIAIVHSIYSQSVHAILTENDLISTFGLQVTLVVQRELLSTLNQFI